MPYYVYSCPECEIELEERRPMELADMPTVCPICHGFCVREVSRFSIGAGARAQGSPAEPQSAGRVWHGGGCSCCRW
ncbi:zinc ribbon domain-containing protein [Chloroflexia bacterium SDU3-3]|nr:zinc ribbon domain-containing protein [Chloroflexia bacterium SDU3-3]